MLTHEELVERQKAGRVRAAEKRKIEAAAWQAMGENKLKEQEDAFKGSLAAREEKPIEVVEAKKVAPDPVAIDDDILETHPLKGKPTTPWKPSKILALPGVLKRPGMVPRWCNEKKDGNIAAKREAGWEFVRVKPAAREQLNRTLNDSIGVDGIIRMRELVLMWIPQEVADARNKYYQDRGNFDPTAMRQALKQNIGQQGGANASVYSKHPLAMEDMNREERFRP